MEWTAELVKLLMRTRANRLLLLPPVLSTTTRYSCGRMQIEECVYFMTHMLCIQLQPEIKQQRKNYYYICLQIYFDLAHKIIYYIGVDMICPYERYTVIGQRLVHPYTAKSRFYFYMPINV